MRDHRCGEVPATSSGVYLLPEVRGAWPLVAHGLPPVGGGAWWDRVHAVERWGMLEPDRVRRHGCAHRSLPT